MDINSIKEKVVNFFDIKSFDAKDFQIKNVNDLKKIAWKYWKLAAVALAALLLVILVIPKNNTYKTPIKMMEKMANSKTSDKMLDNTIAQLNGLGEKEMEQIIEILMKTDSYADLKDMMGESIDDMKNEIGNNYKVKLSVESKEKLDKDSVRDAQDGLDMMAEHFADRAESLEEDSIVLEDEGLSSKDVKKLIKCYKKLAKIFQKAKVTKVIEVEMESKIKGSQLDEPSITYTHMRVYKINGRWISEEALGLLLEFAY